MQTAFNNILMVLAASISLAGLSGCKSNKKVVEAHQHAAKTLLQVANSRSIDYGKQLNKINDKMIKAVSAGDLKEISKLSKAFVSKSNKSRNIIDYNNLVNNTIKEGLLFQYPEVLFHTLKFSNLQKELEQKEAYLQDLLALQKRSSQLEPYLQRRLEIDIDKLTEKISELNKSSEMASLNLQDALQKQQQMLQVLSNIRKAMQDATQSVVKNLQ